MTIALGVLCSNGVVLAADSEISSPGGDIKSTDTKLVAATEQWHERTPSSMAMAGAGHFNYVQALRHTVSDVVMKAMMSDKQDNGVYTQLEAFMLDFQNKHVIPYLKFADPPLVEVLVGTWINNQGKLWATSGGSVRPADFGYESIGVGAGHVMNLLHGYFGDGIKLSIDSATLLATFLIMRAKRELANVGLDTHVLVLANNGPHYVSDPWIEQCDRTFKRFLEFRRQPLLFAIGATKEIEASGLNEARREFDALRQSINASIS